MPKDVVFIRTRILTLMNFLKGMFIQTDFTKFILLSRKVISLALIISLIAGDLAQAMDDKNPGEERKEGRITLRHSASASDLTQSNQGIPTGSPHPQHHSAPDSPTHSTQNTGEECFEDAQVLLISTGGTLVTGHQLTSSDGSHDSLTPGQTSSTQGSPKKGSGGGTSPRSSEEESSDLKSSPDEKSLLGKDGLPLKKDDKNKNPESVIPQTVVAAILPVAGARVVAEVGDGKTGNQPKSEVSRSAAIAVQPSARGSAHRDEVEGRDGYLVVGSVGSSNGSWAAYNDAYSLRAFNIQTPDAVSTLQKSVPPVVFVRQDGYGSGDDTTYLLKDIESLTPQLSPKVQKFLQYLQNYVIQGNTSKVQKATAVPALVVAGTSTCANINIYMYGIMNFNELLMKSIDLDIENATIGNICVTIIGLLFGLDALGRNVASFSKMATPSTKSFAQRKTWGLFLSEWMTAGGAATVAIPSALLSIFYMWQNAQMAMRYNNVSDFWNTYTLFILYYGPGIFVDTLIANAKEAEHYVKKYMTVPVGNGVQWGINKLDPWLGIKPEHPIDLGAALRKTYRETFKELQRLCFLLPPDVIKVLYHEIMRKSLVKGKRLKGQDKQNLELMDSIRVLRYLRAFNCPEKEELLKEEPYNWKNRVAEGAGWTVSLAACWGRYVILDYAMESLVSATKINNPEAYYALVYVLTTIAWCMNGKLEKEYIRDLVYEALGGKKAHCHSRHSYMRLAGLPVLLAASAGTALPYVLAGIDGANQSGYPIGLTVGVIGTAAFSNMLVDLAGYRSSWRKVAFNPTDYLTSGCCPSVGKMRDDLVWRMKQMKRLFKQMDGQALIDLDAVVHPKDDNNWYDMMMSLAHQGHTYGAINEDDFVIQD